GRIVAGEDAKGLLTLNTGRPTVNEWGDVIEVKARAAPTSTVALREVRTPQIDSKAQGGPFPSSKDVKGDLYDIVPDADAVQAKLRLVLSTAAYGPPMLIFQGGGPPGQESSPLQLLALSGQPELKEALPDPPVDSK